MEHLSAFIILFYFYYTSLYLGSSSWLRTRLATPATRRTCAQLSPRRSLRSRRRSRPSGSSMETQRYSKDMIWAYYRNGRIVFSLKSSHAYRHMHIRHTGVSSFPIIARGNSFRSGAYTAYVKINKFFF